MALVTRQKVRAGRSADRVHLELRGSRRAASPDRAAAVRELLKRGLTAEGFSIAGKGTKSQDFGMIDGHEKPAPLKSRKPPA